MAFQVLFQPRPISRPRYGLKDELGWTGPSIRFKERDGGSSPSAPTT